MAQLGQAFLHASLLGTEAEATRFRELKAEYHRQKQQRQASAAGNWGQSSTCRNRHMLDGLQLRLGSSSWRLLQESVVAQAYDVMGNAAHTAFWVGQPLVQGPGSCFQDKCVLHASSAAWPAPCLGCATLSCQAATHSILICLHLQACRRGLRQKMGLRPMEVQLPLMQLQQARRGPAQQLRVGSSGATAPRCSRPDPRARERWATAPPAAWWLGWWTRPPAA